MHIMGDIVIGWDELVMWAEMHSFCPLCDGRFDSQGEVEDHIMRAHP